MSDSDDLFDSMVTNTISDEEFISKFTLSKFWKDLMMMAVQSFPEEYGLDKKSIGPKCKLFIQKQWNLSSWTELSSTDAFHCNLIEQMANKSRVQNGKLQMRLSFGRAKAGMEFQSQSEFDDYVDHHMGEAISFL